MLAAHQSAISLPMSKVGEPSKVSRSFGTAGLAASQASYASMRDPAVLQGLAQTWVAAVDLVTGDPGRRHARVQSAGDHLTRQCRFRRELHILGHAGLFAALFVVDPRPRQLELAVD